MSRFGWAYVNSLVTGAVANGPTNSVQFNSGSQVLSGSSNFTFNPTTNTLVVTGTISASVYQGITVTSTPAGSDKQIQYNSGSTLGASSNLTFDYTTNTLSLTGTLRADNLIVSSSQILKSGSTIFGDDVSDTHQFTGSILGGIVSGTIARFIVVTGSTITGSTGLFGVVTSSAFSGGSFVGTTISGTTAQFTTITGSLFGTASFATTASYISSNFQYEIHVSQVDGNDTTGNGDLLKPVATIGKALLIVSASVASTDRRTIIVHPGTYIENITVNTTNTYLFSTGLLGANCLISGSVTISAASRMSGIKMTNLIVSSSNPIYINNCAVDEQMTVSGSGYLEVQNTSLQCTSGIQVVGPASSGVIFENCSLYPLTVNNASAAVYVISCNQAITPTLTAGALTITRSTISSLTSGATSTALTTAAGSVLVLESCNVYNSLLTSHAAITANGFYSIKNVIYNRSASTLASLSGTGGPLATVSQFQYINADNITSTQGLAVTGSINVSGSITGSTITGSTALFTTLTASSISANNIVAFGPNQSIQFNSAGVLNGSSILTFDGTQVRLTGSLQVVSSSTIVAEVLSTGVRTTGKPVQVRNAGAVIVAVMDESGIVSGSTGRFTTLTASVVTASSQLQVASDAYIGGNIVGSGGFKAGYATYTGSFTAVANSYFVGISTTGSVVTASLNSATNYPSGQTLIFKDIGGNAAINNIRIKPSGSQTIDGATSLVISSTSGSATIVSNGLDGFYIVGLT